MWRAATVSKRVPHDWEQKWAINLELTDSFGRRYRDLWIHNILARPENQQRMLRKPFNYFEAYEWHIRDVCNCTAGTSLCSLVEIGVQSGGNLEFWPKVLEKLWNSCHIKTVSGVDIQPIIDKFAQNDNRVYTYVGDWLN